MANEFVLKGNVRKEKISFVLAKDSNYQVEISKFMGEEIPEQALKTFKNFWHGVAIALGSFTSINNSQKAIGELKKEAEHQLFSEHIIAGDAKILYKKGTTNVLELTADGKKVLDFLLSVSYSEEEIEEGEPEIIY